MALILGIDPGLNNVGWGIISIENNFYRWVGNGTISAKMADIISEKMLNIFNEINKLILHYKPDDCAVEDIFVNMNNLSSLKLAYGRASVLLAIANNKLLPFEYKPNLIKKSVTGNGKASKEQIKFIVNKIFPLAKIHNDHEADALAIALCHGNHRNIKNYI